LKVGASTESLSGFRPLLLESHIRRPKISIMKLRRPKPMPIAAPVLMCVVGARLELSPEPNGSAFKTRAPPAQSLPEGQVALDVNEGVVVLATSTSKCSEVALGIGLSVSSSIELTSWARVVDFGVSWDIVVAVGRVEDSRLDVLDIGRCVRRGLAAVEDIIIKVINMLVR
jgi:hypothetical protein